jgi:phenylalanyl-tRNA synthetase beta subunit
MSTPVDKLPIDYAESFSIHFFIDRNGVPCVSTDKDARHKTVGYPINDKLAFILRTIRRVIMADYSKESFTEILQSLTHHL